MSNYITRDEFLNEKTVKKDPILHTVLLTDKQLTKITYALEDHNICPENIALNCFGCISDHCHVHLRNALLTANKEEVKP